MVSGRWDWGQIVEWKSLLFVLSILFICMAAVAAFQLARIFYYRQTTPFLSFIYQEKKLIFFKDIEFYHITLDFFHLYFYGVLYDFFSFYL